MLQHSAYNAKDTHKCDQQPTVQYRPVKACLDSWELDVDARQEHTFNETCKAICDQ